LIKRNYKLVAVASFVVVVAVLCVVLFVLGKDKPAAGNAAGVTASATPSTDTLAYSDDEEYSYEGVDESILAGMAGTDDSLFSEEDADLEDALFAEEGLRIGVTIGNMTSDADQRILSDLEKASSAAETQKLIYKTYYYNAGGSYDQQLQDVRSLIKNEVDIIIIGATGADNFEMVSYMAEEAGIPVVAYDAPVDTGYVMNVVADDDARGKACGDFIAQNLAEGEIAQILGYEDSAADTALRSAIVSSLPDSETITVLEPVYAQGSKDTAKTAMDGLLGQYRDITAIVAGDGMAEGAIDACIAKEKLPAVMWGDATAGFIKTWYKLVRNGVDISEEGAETPVMLAVEPEEFIVCAQPEPTGISAVAFEIALKLAQGRTLKADVGTTYEYAAQTLITNENIGAYYALVKGQDDDFRISETVSAEMVEALFEPADDDTEAL
jgi:ABC-type sugar transport system substrate-binding protein